MPPAPEQETTSSLRVAYVVSPLLERPAANRPLNDKARLLLAPRSLVEVIPEVPRGSPQKR